MKKEKGRHGTQKNGGGDVQSGSEQSEAIVCVNAGLVIALRNFLLFFDAVFDKDWGFTRNQIADFDAHQTFLRPGEESWTDDWFNYFILLKYYEELNAQITKKQFRIIPRCPSCEYPEKLH